MPFTNYEPPQKICLSPEHNPPSHLVQEPGTYTYQCPSCGQKTTYTVSQAMC